MKYCYSDLSPEQFESLVIAICTELLGAAVQGFSKGPDGGRDAKFLGTARLYPSDKEPWKGTTIIQAKHTNGLNRSFSENDFFNKNGSSSIIHKELPKIKRLRDQTKLNHYMLFSNRRLSGNAETNIIDFIVTQTGIPPESIRLFGIEQMENYLKQYPRIHDLIDIDPLDSPLNVSPDELANIIEALSEYKAIDPKTLTSPTPRISYKEKNLLNHMSDEYANQLRKKYLPETEQIRHFLANPENINFVALYDSIVDEFQLKIIAKRKNYRSFDELMNHLFDLLFDRDPVLPSKRTLTRTILFYMYWNCDIGNEDAVTQ